jgi:hypothetical protein
MPAAVIFVNDDLSSNVQNMLVRQLHITEIIDGYTFDTRVSINSNYVSQAKSAQQRVMVVRDLAGPDNRNLVDLVLFVKAGLITVIQNNITGNHLGCRPLPGQTPSTPGSLKTQHHIYPDQLHGLQFRNYEIHKHDFIDDTRYGASHWPGPPVVTIQVVNVSWGALGVY